MQRIAQLESGSLIADVRRSAVPHEWVEYPATTPEQVVARQRGASIEISNKVPLSRAAIMALSNLQMIAVSATGTNNIEAFVAGAPRSRVA